MFYINPHTFIIVLRQQVNSGDKVAAVEISENLPHVYFFLHTYFILDQSGD
jgi:hypothetical protein